MSRTPFVVLALGLALLPAAGCIDVHTVPVGAGGAGAGGHADGAGGQGVGGLGGTAGTTGSGGALPGGGTGGAGGGGNGSGGTIAGSGAAAGGGSSGSSGGGPGGAATGAGGTGAGGQPGAGGDATVGCRDAAGVNKVCDPICGDGHKDLGEECDDGNLADADGCSARCAIEGGWSCTIQQVSDSQPCTATPAQQCLKLPITYRDFRREKSTGGHPDFLYLGATDPTTGKVSRWCVANTSGPAKLNEATPRAWDTVLPDLANGKPVLNGAPKSDCAFTDWSVADTRVPGYSATLNSPLRDLVSGAVPLPAGSTLTVNTSGKQAWRGQVPTVTDATSFSQWFTDNSFNIRSDTTLELGAVADGQFRFASGSHTVYDGFFPLDPPGTRPAPGTVRMTASGEPLECNLWPYWFPAAFPNCTGAQYLFPPSVDGALNPNGVWNTGLQGVYHNFYFTTEVRYTFVFHPGFSVQFNGDDDVYIFINGKLVIDLGGTHQRLPGLVTLGLNGVATIVEGGSLTAAGAVMPCPGADLYTKVATSSPADCRARTRTDLGLEDGRRYELAIFHAERHPIEDNYQLTIAGSYRNRSVCAR